jgi:hypothetical protein
MEKMTPKNPRRPLVASAALVGFVIIFMIYVAFMHLYAQFILAGLIALYGFWILVIPAWRNLMLVQGGKRHESGPSIRAMTGMAGAAVFAMILGVGSLEANHQYLQAGLVALIIAWYAAKNFQKSVLEPPAQQSGEPRAEKTDKEG